MSKFTYKTRGGSKPQGKPNVYMACHPEDQSLFLEKYSDQILDIHNCAIWYETEYDAPYDQDELVFNLEQMQLIVILITGKLLTTPNRVMNLEFSIALEKHIPVLPIMLEQGIDGIYTEKFGGLHYLDPNDLDPTKREFKEVLESYLKSVLIGDEMAERVRAAFDAYIFLSYRKKDRAKAQKLMRLIHKKPLCYDIAIWYDEFLVPGEDFDHLIHEMINNSDVFLMAVTPNLINEENYISRTEYPAAKESNKKIIPVEMEETDRQELKAKYSGIPDCISNENEEGIAEEILLALHKTALSQSDADPEHSFLIGLAYLDGISVEVDFNRAVQMIRKAGDAEVPEAIKQLISMYETGKGVPIDYNEGIKWRKRYTKYLQKQCSVNQDAEIVLDYLYALLNLGDALNNLRRLDEAENVYRAILTELNNHTLDSLEFQKISGHAYGRLGNSTFMQSLFTVSIILKDLMFFTYKLKIDLYSLISRKKPLFHKCEINE